MALTREQHIVEIVYGVMDFIAEARTAPEPQPTRAELEQALEQVKEELAKE